MSNQLERDLAAQALGTLEHHSVDAAPRMLADSSYPSRYERAWLLYYAPDDWYRKHISNLLAMLDEARKRGDANG